MGKSVGKIVIQALMLKGLLGVLNEKDLECDRRVNVRASRNVF